MGQKNLLKLVPVMFARRIQIGLFGILIFFICFAGQKKAETNELIVQSEAKLYELLSDQSEGNDGFHGVALGIKTEIQIVINKYCKSYLIYKINKVKLLGESKKGRGYEGITYDNINDKFYLIEESQINKGAYNARLNHASKDFIIKSKKWLKYNFQSDNKGFEGLTYVNKNNKTYVLALCEGNDCDSGKIGKMHGAGRIKVFEKKKKKWKYIASIRIPQSACPSGCRH